MKRKIELHIMYVILLTLSGISSIVWGHDFVDASQECKIGHKIATDLRDRIASENWDSEQNVLNEQKVKQSLNMFLGAIEKLDSLGTAMNEPIADLFPMGKISMKVHCFLHSSESATPINFNYHWNSVTKNKFEDSKRKYIKNKILGSSLKSLADDNELISEFTPHLVNLSNQLDIDVSQVVWYLSAHGLRRIQACLFPTTCR